MQTTLSVKKNAVKTIIKYAVALILPEEVEQTLDMLRGEYRQYMNYMNIPHITLLRPSILDIDNTTLTNKLDIIANKTRPFPLLIHGVAYFEGENNVAYLAIENEQMLTDLHLEIVKSLSGMIKDEFADGKYSPERFTPHITIGQHIPDDMFHNYKRVLLDFKIHHEIYSSSFALFSSDEDNIWKSVRTFELAGI